MVLFSSTPDQWPANQVVDDQKGLMGSTGRLMDKSDQRQPQLPPQQEPLRCPRCDSSNTKFCYYNNYSLSQPRYYCKACKRYWTRGGTLRNVPVGGGCRKNKRVKRPIADGTSSVCSSASSANTNPPSQPQIDLSSTSNHMNPLFYGLHSSPSDINLSFSRLSSGISNVESVAGFDIIQPQLNALGLGFSSGSLSCGADDDYRSGYSSSKQIHDLVSSNSLLSRYSIFGNTSSSSTATVTAPPAISSLLASKSINGCSKDTRAPNNFHFTERFDQDAHQIGYEETEMELKRVKLEAQNNKLDWNVDNLQNQSDQSGVYDPSVYWNSFGATWHDPANIGSPLTFLI